VRKLGFANILFTSRNDSETTQTFQARHIVNSSWKRETMAGAACPTHGGVVFVW
jgi:hypothetical protein